MRIFVSAVLIASSLYAGIKDADKLYDDAKMHFVAKDYEEAIFSYELAQREYIKARYNGDKLHKIYFALGRAYDAIRLPDEAREYYLKAIDIIKDKREYNKLKTTIYTTLGINYYISKEYKKSLSYLLKSYKNSKVAKDRFYLLYLIATIYTKSSSYIVAKAYVNKALSEYKKYNIDDKDTLRKVKALESRLK
jgi:tetratricopeptide (TPR) repeat protein